ncbi:MAG: 3-hydroxyacyl-CoA dehydrogenase [Bacilli bacterium]|nr:3-hydroxyacyl-CoA dehydrogenase [Bacilli bacterium]
MNYKKIVVVGGGILGSQIAFQSAYCGVDVTILIRKEDSKESVLEKLEKLHNTYIDTINQMAKEGIKSVNWARGISESENFNKDELIDKVNKAYQSIVIETEQEIALKNTDLVIESITENIDVKIALYKQIAPLLEEKTVVVTNSSTLLPSKLATYTGRKEKFLAMHFANSIWKNNITEIMGHSGTDQKYFDEVVEFSKKINMIPLVAKEEKSGYILNSMLVPFLLSAMDLVANGVSDPETIDKAWTLGTGAPKGPFQIIDTVGLETARNIVLQYQKVPNIFDPLLKKMMLPYNYDAMLDILNKYIEEGKIGKSVNEGFYKYDL